MNIEQFRNISIRGRMVFAINCFENALTHFNLHQDTWAIIIGKFWKFTSERYLDIWYEEMLECNPDVILEDVSFEKKGIEHLTEEEYVSLKNLYKGTNVIVLELISKMIDLGNVELYGHKIDKKFQSFYRLQAIIDILVHNNIIIPKVTVLQKFEFDFEGGWGKRFTRDLIFIEHPL